MAEDILLPTPETSGDKLSAKDLGGGRKLQRALLSDVTGIKDVKVSNDGSLQTRLAPQGTAAFGESLVTEPTPNVQLTFSYNINLAQVIVQANGGTVTQAAGEAVLSTGAGANQSVYMSSKRPTKYNPGQGAGVRFTARFTPGVVNSRQMIGIGNRFDGFAFGFEGTIFSTFRLKGGVPEVRTLTIATGSSTAENITITLNGDAETVVAVTNTADTTLTAFEIAAHDYKDVGDGWTTTVVNNTVIFVSWSDQSKAGTYSLSGATTAVGTFASTIVGVTTEVFTIAQTAASGDKFNGSGETGVTLNTNNGSVYQIVYQYLGYGLIEYSIEDPVDGEFHIHHRIEYSNNFNSPSVVNPTLPVFVFVENTTNTTDIILRTSSLEGFTQGKSILLGPRRGVKGSSTTVGTTEIPLLSVCNNTIFQASINRVVAKLELAFAVADHTKPVEVNVYRNSKLTGSNFVDIDSNISVLATDISATAIDITVGEFLFSIPVARQGGIVVDLSGLEETALLFPSDIITFTGIADSGAGATIKVSGSIGEFF